MDRVHGDSRPKQDWGALRERRREAIRDGSALNEPETLRQAFANLLELANRPPVLRIGRGAAVKRQELEAHSRSIFAKALYDLVPDSTAQLVTAHALEIESQYEAAERKAVQIAANDPALASLPYSVVILADVSAPFADAAVAKWDFIEEWQRRFKLCGDWLADLASRTMRMALAMHGVGIAYRAPIGSGALLWEVENYASDARAMGREVVFEYGTPVYPVFVDDLKAPDEKGGFDMFDPFAENVDAATDRLIEALRPRVRRALEAIEAEHRELTGAPCPVVYKSPKAFEWLVRYQVLNEDMGEVADAAGVSEQAVSKAIQRAKDQIGLELRKRSKPGPKPGTTPNRVR